MKPARAAAYLGGGILLASWLASAAGVGRPSIPQPPAPSTEAMQLDALASGVQSQAAHLRERLAAAPAPHAQTRNPFAFAAAERPQPAAVDKAADAEPVATVQTTPEPNLILLGLAEDGSARTAMIESGDDLVMATEGQTIVGRYRVARISTDAIELVDLVTGATRRLFLKIQASLL
jgi:Tfp pilus assembly protein PilP